MKNIGDKAPEVLGINEKGEEIRLSAYKGKKIVLYFYPKDSTSGCTAQACSLRDIRILDDCASYVIIADQSVQPTSELPSHLSVHNNLIAKGSPYKASVHTHPIELVAMTHNKKFLEKDVASNLLWSMIPETKAFCPRGLGIIPYQLPSSVELAEATIRELDDYDVVMWEKHGVFAVDVDVMAAFDQVDVLNKSALIYIAAKNMGFEPDGMSQLQMKEMSVAFNLPK